MLTGEQLGRALTAAMSLKNVKEHDVAAEFGVKTPSVYGWKATGRIAQKHLNHLVEYFSDVVPPSHWGMLPLLPSLPNGVDELEAQLLAIFRQLSDQSREFLLADANKYLTLEHPENGPHNPFGRRKRTARV